VTLRKLGCGDPRLAGGPDQTGPIIVLTAAAGSRFHGYGRAGLAARAISELGSGEKLVCRTLRPAEKNSRVHPWQRSGMKSMAFARRQS
jgi:hypothetical protein